LFRAFQASQSNDHLARGVAVPSGYISSHTSRIVFIQRLLDAVLIIGTLYSVAWVHGVRFREELIEISIIAALSFYLVGQARGIYGSWRISSIRSEIGAVLLVWVTVFAVIVFFAFVTKTSADFSRRVMLTWLMLAPACLIGMRLVVRVLLRELRRSGFNTRSVAIVGANSAALKLVEKLNATPWTGLVFKGYYDYASADRLAAGIPSLAGDITQLQQQVRAGKIDIVYIALPINAEQRIIKLVNMFADTTASVYFLPDFFIFDLMHARWVSLNGVPVISIYESPFHSVNGWVKKIEDVALSVIILAWIALPMLAIAMVVKVTSPGPVIFKQRRYGLNGEMLYVWKFRSMTVCEDGANISQAKRGDLRVTRVGEFLRKTSLDELPQFINVLQGRMSIVGPRPHAVAHNEEYRKLIPGYMLRHKVKPGITGLAQVNGWRGETDTLEKMQKRVEYDLQYIQEWSLWLDLKIIFRTAFGGWRGKRAY
jgi:putative colanic acid biosynthesis UDP-glucose lipid carrier transferase